MKCCENVIVTLQIRPGEYSLDMELPAFLPMDQLKQRFLETIRVMDPMHYGTAVAVQFYRNNQQLSDEITLAKAGIWEGTILEAHLSLGVQLREN